MNNGKENCVLLLKDVHSWKNQEL